MKTPEAVGDDRNPEYMAFIEWLFEKAAFIAALGFGDAGPGQCDSELAVLPKHL
ncbi:MAG: hypothetical protein M3305_12225 [Actinomycetota bacterium]|nr:hypothetical protein [Actinomycetota bacterium]